MASNALRTANGTVETTRPATGEHQGRNDRAAIWVDRIGTTILARTLRKIDRGSLSLTMPDGSVERIELSRPWRYFPHVSSADLGAGFQERLEALQGHQRTFYTGEIFSFSMVEAVVAHARKIVDRHFAPPGGRPVLCGTRAHGGQALVQLRPSVQLRPRPSSSPPCVLRRARAPQPCPSRSVRTGTTQNGVRFELTSIRPGPGRAPRRGARARGLQRGCFRELHARAMAQRHGVARVVGQLMIRSRRFAPGGAPGEHSIDLLAGTRVRR